MMLGRPVAQGRLAQDAKQPQPFTAIATAFRPNAKREGATRVSHGPESADL